MDEKGDRDVIIYARLWAHIDSHMCAYTLTHTLLLDDQLSAATLSYSEGQHVFSENNNRLKKQRAANFEVIGFLFIFVAFVGV